MITLKLKSKLDYKNKLRNIDKYSDEKYNWTIQYDDRLSAFYVFLFPTPILGITTRTIDGKKYIKTFPVSGNSFLQRKATEIEKEKLGVHK